MSILLWIIFGGVIGWVASLIMHTDAEQGLLLNVIIGVIGAVVGGWLMSFFGESGISGFNLYSFVVALIGAIIFITVAKALSIV
jgi:uncharacterized membrane protein YeaQ/YmgE (transglycosylase-associated protein family)